MANQERGISHHRRESRQTLAAQRLPVFCQLGGDDHEDSKNALRLQRLRLLGIIGQRANLLADLAWEAAA